jgi:hypothetical protein
MFYNINIKNENLSVNIEGEVSPSLIEGLISSINSSLMETEASIAIPNTLEESIKFAKKLGYANANAKSFSSAHRVSQTMPLFVSSLGLNGFINWYRQVEGEIQPKKRLKQVSLTRYFDSAKEKS